MKSKSVLFLTLASGIVTNNFAGTMGSAVSDEMKSVMALSIGPAWYKEGKTQTFFLQSDVEKTYAAHKKNDDLGVIELFYGRQMSLNSLFLGQIGVSLAAASHARLSGDIWEDADPDFNNFYYNYKVNHAHIAIKGKLLAEMGYIVTPYLSGSIGIGRNRSHDFEITPKLFEELPAPAFVSHTKTALSYTLGAGIQKQLNEYWSAGIGYEFSDWGRSGLSAAPGQTLNSGVQLSHFYINQLQFSLNYMV